MAVPEQISAHSAIDADGFVLQGQLYVPAAAVQSSRALYGVDETSDAAGNHYAALAVAPHLPLARIANGHTYLSGTTGAQQFALGAAPGAGFLQCLEGFTISAQPGTAQQTVAFLLSGMLATWAGHLFGTVTTTQGYTYVVTFPTPLVASAANTQIIMQTTFPAASTYELDIQLWGFNRAV